MTNTHRVFAAAALIAAAAWSLGAQESSEPIAEKPAAAEGTQIALDIVPGKKWKSIMWAGPIPMTKTPQIAAWVETAEGNFVATLTVTSKAATGNWFGNPEGGRPDSLPVWLAAAKRTSANAGGESIDAVTSATPKAGIDVDRTVGILPGKEYRIFVEVNASFDYNADWPKKAKQGEANYSGVNGQPSLVYSGTFTAGTPATVALEPVGTGSVDGSSGEIASGTKGLTTALSLIKSAKAEIR